MLDDARNGTNLNSYLSAYRTIFTSNEKARYFRTWYVDAFAETRRVLAMVAEYLDGRQYRECARERPDRRFSRRARACAVSIVPLIGRSTISILTAASIG